MPLLISARSYKILFLSFLIMLSNQLLAKEDTPLTLDGVETINAEQAKAFFDSGALFVDPRKGKDWDAGRIPDAVHLELESDLTEENLAKHAKKDGSIIFYCNGIKCKVSYDASVKARDWDYTSLKWFRGGLPAWKAAGYPVE